MIMQQKVSCMPFLFDDKSGDEPTEFQIFLEQREMNIDIIWYFLGMRLWRKH